jgi:hypothetical protein
MPEAMTPGRSPQIHFAALLGVEVDADLIPWWAPHYAALELDSYTVFLHESLYESRNRQAEDMLSVLGFQVRRVPENALRDSPNMPGCPDGVREIILQTFAASLHPADFLVTADGDEIQEWTELPRNAVSRGISVVLGALTDRFDDTLHNAFPDKSLEDSFPGAHPDLNAYFKKTPLTQKKICMAPADYPVEYSGSHAVKFGYKPPKRLISSGPIRVNHYRWRESAVRRVQGRYYWTDAEISAMKKFFSVES